MFLRRIIFTACTLVRLLGVVGATPAHVAGGRPRHVFFFFSFHSVIINTALVRTELKATVASLSAILPEHNNNNNDDDNEEEEETRVRDET